MADPTEIGFIAGASAALTVPVLYYWLRSRLVKRVGVSMGVAAGDENEAIVEEVKAREVPAAGIPDWIIHTADTWTPDTTAARTLSEKKAVGFLRKLTLVDFVFGLLYLIVPAFLGFVFSVNLADDGAVYLGALFCAILWASGVVRYILFRRAFRAFDLSQSRKRQAFLRVLIKISRTILFLVSLVTPGNIAGITYIPSMLRAVFGQLIRFISSIAMASFGILFSVIQIFSGETDLGGSAFGLLAASLIHLVGFIHFARKMRQDKGLKLLVLRVFDIDEISQFTFNGLMNYWGHFGAHYTIVDQSVLRGRNESNDTKSVFLVMALMCVVFAIAAGLSNYFAVRTLRDGAWSIGIAVMLMTLGAAWVVYRVCVIRTDKLFIRSGEQLSKQLEVLDTLPRGISMRFRHVHAMCHDNTWFPTVAEFARRADVVLMDLRGYSQERQGCQREVDFLFDALPLDRILFLTDVADDIDLIENMLADRYKELRISSPNLSLTAPQLNIYLAQDNDRRDMQGIMDWLISAASAHAARGAEAEVETNLALSETSRTAPEAVREAESVT